jgi:hypothetical protein
MLLAGKPLFLGRGDDLAVHDQGGGGIMVESRDAWDFGHTKVPVASCPLPIAGPRLRVVRCYLPFGF